MSMSRIVVSNALKRTRQQIPLAMSIVLSRATLQPQLAPSITNTNICKHTCFINSKQMQIRSFGSDGYYKLRKKEKKVDPYAVLGVSPDIKYAMVEKTFIRIAMKHHPDTAEASTPEQEDEHKEIFMAARSAFEMLEECPVEGLAILRSESDLLTDDDLDVWFKDETGFDMPFMDPQTMKEVAEITEKLGGGLDRDGGMWTLARMVTENMKSGGNGQDILKLEAGDIRDRSINGILRRKRRR
jgi:hypothetical protein